MKLDKIIIVGFIILVTVFAFAGPEASSRQYSHIPLSAILVQGAVNIEADDGRKEKALLSLNFTLGNDSNGISPGKEVVEIKFRTDNSEGTQGQYIVIFIPAYSFERINHYYEIYDSTSPADIGIKVLVVDEGTGEVIKDLTNSLKAFHSLITPVEKEAQFYLLIDAMFEHDHKDLVSFTAIRSSSESTLIIGDDSGATLANTIQFMQPD